VGGNALNPNHPTRGQHGAISAIFENGPLLQFLLRKEAIFEEKKSR
jgi:hypothetical protein